MKRAQFLAVLLSAAALAGCEKNAVQDITGPLPSARILFFNYGVGSPDVHFYANDTKMTATNSATGAESIDGLDYGEESAGGRYSGIAPGQYTITGRVSATTDKDLPISTQGVAIADGKHYSFYQSGIYNAATKKVDSFIVEDDLPATIDYSTSMVRFVNAISNAAAPMVLYATNDESGTVYTIGGAVSYKGAGAFTKLPGGVYDLSVRYQGQTNNVIVSTNVSFNNGRIYTVSARGNATSTAAATRPVLDNTSNR